MDAVELWEKARALLKGSMNEVSYNAWIKSLTAVALEGQTLHMRTPAEYIKAMIMSNYKDKIEQRLEEVSGLPIIIEVSTLDAGDSKVLSPMPGTPELNPKYTFETFIVGSANRFAHAAAEAVAKAPGTAYNPLFIYGGTDARNVKV